MLDSVAPRASRKPAGNTASADVVPTALSEQLYICCYCGLRFSQRGLER